MTMIPSRVQRCRSTPRICLFLDLQATVQHSLRGLQLCYSPGRVVVCQRCAWTSVLGPDPHLCVWGQVCCLMRTALNQALL